jgi:hypothetical protein
LPNNYNNNTMKAKSVLIGFFLALVLVSCKNENSKDKSSDDSIEKIVQKKNVFKFTINAIVKKDDNFQIYYKENEQDDFVEKNSLYVSFKGSESPQDIVFELPEDVVPNYVRFDYGTNKEQTEVVFNSVQLNYLDKSFTIKNNELANFISFNEGTLKFDKAKGSITPFVLKDGTYDPMSFTSTTLYDQVQLLLK